LQQADTTLVVDDLDGTGTVKTKKSKKSSKVKKRKSLKSKERGAEDSLSPSREQVDDGIIVNNVNLAGFGQK
jgi:hypothetical protein